MFSSLRTVIIFRALSETILFETAALGPVELLQQSHERGGLVPHWQVLTPLSQELWRGSEQHRQLGGVGGDALRISILCQKD